MNKILLPIIFLTFILAFSLGAIPSFASDNNDDSSHDDRYDDDNDRDDDKYKSSSDYREERKEYRESKVCVNKDECVHDEEFKEAREKYREERQKLRDGFHSERQFFDSNKRYFKMLEIMRKSSMGDDYLLPPLLQMSIVDNAQEIQCREGLDLIFKENNDHPMCVKPSTAERMIERGIAYTS